MDGVDGRVLISQSADGVGEAPGINAFLVTVFVET